jgi:hypothetical protein
MRIVREVSLLGILKNLQALLLTKSIYYIFCFWCVCHSLTASHIYYILGVGWMRTHRATRRANILASQSLPSLQSLAYYY